jgi:hypothetical protein
VGRGTIGGGEDRGYKIEKVHIKYRTLDVDVDDVENAIITKKSKS